MSDAVVAVMVGLFFSIPPSVAAWYAYKIHKAVRTPSGDPIGHVTERTEHLASTNHAQLLQHGKTYKEAHLAELHVRLADCLAALDELRAGGGR